MAEQARDDAFVRLVAEQRGLLGSAARLMFADPRRAEDVVESALAQLYRTWHRHADPRLAALRLVLHATPEDVALPWRRDGNVELVDGAPEPTDQHAIVADLASLSEDLRRAVILRHLCRLPAPDAAAVIDTDPAHAETWLGIAETELARLDPKRLQPGGLHRELAEAAGPHGRDIGVGTAEGDGDADVGASDLAHGRLLVHRRRLRSAVLVAAILVAGLLGVAQLASLQQVRQERADSGSPGAATPSSSRSPLPQTSFPQGACDTQPCRDAILRRWRTEVAGIATSYVDPRRAYFTGGSSSVNGRYDLNSWWRGPVGALELDLSLKRAGATRVRLEIAATSDSATPCGQRTRQTCVVTHSKDRTRVRATRTTGMSRGIEVQFSAPDEQVISVVARNVSGGERLEITKEQLMGLVTDPRLRLPPL